MEAPLITVFVRHSRKQLRLTRFDWLLLSKLQPTSLLFSLEARAVQHCRLFRVTIASMTMAGFRLLVTLFCPVEHSD